MLDLDRIRAEFPALTNAKGGLPPWILFDNAGGSQTLARVADRVRAYLLSPQVQLGASYETSRASSDRLAAASVDTARFIGASDPSEIVFGASTTQLLDNLSSALLSTMKPGDEIVVTEADHEANIGPWRRLESRGLVVKEWPINHDSLRLEVSALVPLLTPRTRLVCFTHVSNVLGSIHDVAAITGAVRAHSPGARVLVDGVAYAPHAKIDVAAWDVDYYVFSFYKVYGPHFAVLYGKRALLEELPCVHHDFVGKSAVPYKLQPGNVCFELAHAVSGIYQYFTALGPDAWTDIAVHEEQLSERLLAFLRGVPSLTIHGERTADRARRVPTISFTVAGQSSKDIVEGVDAHRVGIRFGDFYARHLIDALNLRARGGVVRASMVHYNSVAEVDRLVGALGQVLAR
ncbi:MAG: cysteine desulfurase-like protein [Polyangiales bacterium]